MADEAKLRIPICSTLKRWWCDVCLGVFMEKSWAYYVDKSQLQTLQFLVHLNDLLSILLSFTISSCSGSDPQQTVTMIYFDVSLTLGSA